MTDISKANGEDTPFIKAILTEQDRTKFLEMCKSNNISDTELASRAIVDLLNREESGKFAEIENRLVKSMQEMEDRITAKLNQTNMDVGTIYQVLWFRTHHAHRRQMLAEAQLEAIERLQRLEQEDKNAVEKPICSLPSNYFGVYDAPQWSPPEVVSSVK